MIQLLQDLRAQLSDGAQSRVDELLASVVEDVADATESLQKLPDKDGEADAEQEEEQADADGSAEVGGSIGPDTLDEDLMRDEVARATGFVGKASDVQWFRKLQTHHHNIRENADPYEPPGQHAEAATEHFASSRRRQADAPLPNLIYTRSASFFLDDECLEVDLDSDPFELPSFDEAERLLQIYMRSCYNFFPLLGKKAFTRQFYHYYAAQRRGEPYNLTQSWQAQLNAVFAIGAVYHNLTMAEGRENECDHSIYHSRAWALVLKDRLWFAHPNLPQMQISGLLSFYYLCTGHINRSWVLSGMAVRFGYALGMYIRNEDRSLGAADKEILSRIWWGHCSLESLLATITGRPSIAFRQGCTVPCPLPLSTEEIEDHIIESRFGVVSSSWRASDPLPGPSILPVRLDSGKLPANLEPANSGSYLKNVIQLSEVTQSALRLYTAGMSGLPWHDVQEQIVRLTEDLNIWAKSLPEGFNFFKYGSFAPQAYERERNTLDILYHGTLILITRPCLCRLDRRTPNQGARSSEINQRSAITCVEAAKAVARLLPDNPENAIAKLYEITPWWTLVHTIMQSLIVLLLELSYETIQLPHDRREIMASLKKLVRWIRAMSFNNQMAQRAYVLVMNLLRELAATARMDFTDLLQEDSSGTAAAEAQASSPSHSRRFSSSHSADERSTPGLPPTELPARAQHLYSRSISDPQQVQLMDHTLYSQSRQETDSSYGAYHDSWSASEASLPGLFFTKFDEQNPLPGFGSKDHDMLASE
ncbi:fungal-specific transcription factor domain-containing protein [Ampelomyces quisqualis]|uniref:Fungal-specific transcription factor domain-containing protein n=1 Tax=Ampelomyces quisqualis TaxID=50730 RepID=A0A6A5QGB0_AMPQU|nr:fungal-specific transcription factor domain-containing protein [Ampelomyces quisqualis]